MLIVCAVAFWEAGRACFRTGSNTVRLRALSASQRAAPKPKPKTSHKPRTLTKAECRELSAYCERDPAEPLPPAEARFAELLAKLDQGSESFRAQTKAQARASASTAARTAECGVQTDSPQEYMPTPTVRTVETPYRDHSSALRPRKERSLLTVIAGVYAMYPIHSSVKCAPTALHALEPRQGRVFHHSGELVAQSQRLPPPWRAGPERLP